MTSTLQRGTRKRGVTLKYVRRVLGYNPKTGQFRWREKVAIRVKRGDAAGWINPLGYRIISLQNVDYPAHRVAWFFFYGKPPKGHLDHIDGDPSNNAITNLREADRFQNLRNARKRRDSSSPYKGVAKRSEKSWQAYIRENGKRRHLGSRKTARAAAKLYDAAARQLFGVHARVNFPTKGEQGAVG